MEQQTLHQHETAQPSGCTHHWLIDLPEGPVSKGVCRLCGEEREFNNYADVDWFAYAFPGEPLTREQYTGGVPPEYVGTPDDE